MKKLLIILLFMGNFLYGQNIIDLSNFYYTNKIELPNSKSIQFALDSEFVNVAQQIFYETACEKLRVVLTINRQNLGAIQKIALICSNKTQNLEQFEHLLGNSTVLLINGSLLDLFEENQQLIFIPLTITKSDFIISK